MQIRYQELVSIVRKVENALFIVIIFNSRSQLSPPVQEGVTAAQKTAYLHYTVQEICTVHSTGETLPPAAPDHLSSWAPPVRMSGCPHTCLYLAAVSERECSGCSGSRSWVRVRVTSGEWAQVVSSSSWCQCHQSVMMCHVITKYPSPAITRKCPHHRKILCTFLHWQWINSSGLWS